MALRTLVVDPKLVVRSGIGALVLLMGIFILTATVAPLPLETPTLAPPPLDIPTPAQLQESIKTLEGTTDVAVPDRAKALEVYRLALSRLQEAQQYSDSATRYQQALKSAPAETVRIRRLLDTADKPAISSVDPKASLDSLTRQLTAIQDQLHTLQNQRTELDQRTTALQTRPEGIQKELAEAKADLARLEQELHTPPSPPPSNLMEKANRSLLLAESLLRTRRIAALELEQQSADVRLALLSAQRDVVDKQLRDVQARVTELQTLINQWRLLEASQVAQQAAQTAEQVAEQPAIIRQAAADNAALSQQLTTLAERIEQAPLTHQLHMGIERAFREHHIEIPFPQRDIHIRYPDVPMHPVEAEVISASRPGL